MDVVFKTDKAVFNYRVAGIWIEDGHVLIHKAVNDSHWSLPGGRVAIAEESKSSVIREFYEELNMKMKVDRLVWIVENFFNYDGKDFHEIGFYYLVEPDENSNQIEFQNEPFYGAEGERLIFKWSPIKDLNTVALYPQFLRSKLIHLPLETQHLVVKQ